MRQSSTRPIWRCGVRGGERALVSAAALALALFLYAGVAAGHAYAAGRWLATPRPRGSLSPAACSTGCTYHGRYYYYDRDGFWLCDDGGTWYYYDACWHRWVPYTGANSSPEAVSAA